MKNRKISWTTLFALALPLCAMPVAINANAQVHTPTSKHPQPAIIPPPSCEPGVSNGCGIYD